MATCRGARRPRTQWESGRPGPGAVRLPAAAAPEHGHFPSFAVAFSLIPVFTGVFANFSHGFRLVGGALPWSWLVVLAGQLLVDLLSIHTACFDWELAARAGRSEYPFQTADVTAARAILSDTMARAEAIRACSDDGLRAIVKGYMRVNTICLPAGHYRVEEGSEHYLFYELEERLKRPFIHGWIVGLGVHLLSRLQENGHAGAVDFIDRVGLRYHPADLGIHREDLVAALGNLRHYVESRRDLWYTILQEREITPAWIDEALATLRFSTGWSRRPGRTNRPE